MLGVVIPCSWVYNSNQVAGASREIRDEAAKVDESDGVSPFRQHSARPRRRLRPRGARISRPCSSQPHRADAPQQDGNTDTIDLSSDGQPLVLGFRRLEGSLPTNNAGTKASHELVFRPIDQGRRYKGGCCAWHDAGRITCMISPLKPHNLSPYLTGCWPQGQRTCCRHQSRRRHPFYYSRTLLGKVS